MTVTLPLCHPPFTYNGRPRESEMAISLHDYSHTVAEDALLRVRRMAIRKQDYLKTAAGRRTTLKGISLVRALRKGDCTRVGRWQCMSHSFESHIGRRVGSANAQNKTLPKVGQVCF